MLSYSSRPDPPGWAHHDTGRSQADNYDLPHCPCKQADGTGNICLAAEHFWPKIRTSSPAKLIKIGLIPNNSLEAIFIKEIRPKLWWLTNSCAKNPGQKLILYVKINTAFILTSSDNDTVWVTQMWESDLPHLGS